jgi:hypothetical protein
MSQNVEIVREVTALVRRGGTARRLHFEGDVAPSAPAEDGPTAACASHCGSVRA